MVIGFFGLDGHTGHEGEGGGEIGKLEFPVQ
jgi:hypothetical protein